MTDQEQPTEKTKTSMERFAAQNGKPATYIAMTFALAPFLLCIIVGAAVGTIAALPGFTLAGIAAIPHWIRARSQGGSS